MAENLARGLGKKSVNIMYLNNQNGRILVGMKSQEIHEFQKQIMLGAARIQNENRKMYFEFDNVNDP